MRLRNRLLLLPLLHLFNRSCTMQISPGFTQTEALLGEAIMTCFLCYVVHMTAVDTRSVGNKVWCQRCLPPPAANCACRCQPLPTAACRRQPPPSPPTAALSQGFAPLAIGFTVMMGHTVLLPV